METIKKLKEFAKLNHVPIVRDDTLAHLLKLVDSPSVFNILEIGTAIGYSGICMLNANKNAKLTTIEKSEERVNLAKKNFEECSLSNRVEIIFGDAKDELEKLVQKNQKFDIIFLDGPKGQYVNYLKSIKNLMTDTSLLFADNVFFGVGLTKKHNTIKNRLAEFLEIIKLPPFSSEVYYIDEGYAIIKLRLNSDESQRSKKMIELLSPAGSMEKLKTAFHYGADACYFAGKKYGLRAFADNFDEDGLAESVEYAHSLGKKCYITLNILAHNSDFDGLIDYVKYLEELKVDAVIVSDLGIMQFVKTHAPNLQIHVSTQANITNKYAAKVFADAGASRLILARELSIKEIKEIREFLPDHVELECFVHGAMCISYSGRCLLSNYLSERDSNRGACIQACRFQYSIIEKTRRTDENVLEGGYEMQEDNRGTYILNSKDLCMIEYLKELVDAGVTSFKIEGRMKSVYYVATVTNAYRRAIDAMLKNEKLDKSLVEELEKTSHRRYTSGFYFNEKNKEYLTSSNPIQTHEFIAVVLEDAKDGKALIEQRNKFEVGDKLEILSPGNNFNKVIAVEKLTNEDGEEITVANQVQQKLLLNTDINLSKGDILRRKVENK